MAVPATELTAQQHSCFESELFMQMLVERELTVADFDEDLELKFHPRGTSGPVPTPPHKLNFSFKFKVRPEFLFIGTILAVILSFILYVLGFVAYYT